MDYTQETVEQCKARLRAEDVAEKAARAKQIEDAEAPTRNVNAEYFAEQAKLEEQIAANKPVALPKKTSEEIAAEHTARYPYTNPQPARDHLLDAEPQYVRDAMNYHPEPLKKSITLQPQPDPEVLREYNSKRPQPGMADIMNRPMSPADQRNAELQQGPVLTRPSKPCPNCGEAISPETGFHYNEDGSVCILPGNEEFARREGIVVPAKK